MAQLPPLPQAACTRPSHPSEAEPPSGLAADPRRRSAEPSLNGWPQSWEFEDGSQRSSGWYAKGQRVPQHVCTRCVVLWWRIQSDITLKGQNMNVKMKTSVKNGGKVLKLWWILPSSCFLYIYFFTFLVHINKLKLDWTPQMIELWGKTKAGEWRGSIIIPWLLEDQLLFACLLHSRSFPNILENSVCAGLQRPRFFHHFDLCTLKVSCYLWFQACYGFWNRKRKEQGKSLKKALPLSWAQMSLQTLSCKSITFANALLLKTQAWDHASLQERLGNVRCGARNTLNCNLFSWSAGE